MAEQDPTRPSLESFSSGGHPFSIPSGHDVRVPLCGFQTANMRQQKGPWVTMSAFEASGLALTAVILDTKGGTMSYKDGMTTSSTTSDDHLSASLGLTIGYPFLNASVTGQYDKDVIESHNVGSPPPLLLSAERSTTNAFRAFRRFERHGTHRAVLGGSFSMRRRHFR